MRHASDNTFEMPLLHYSCHTMSKVTIKTMCWCVGSSCVIFYLFAFYIFTFFDMSYSYCNIFQTTILCILVSLTTQSSHKIGKLPSTIRWSAVLHQKIAIVWDIYLHVSFRDKKYWYAYTRLDLSRLIARFKQLYFINSTAAMINTAAAYLFKDG